MPPKSKKTTAPDALDNAPAIIIPKPIAEVMGVAALADLSLAQALATNYTPFFNEVQEMAEKVKTLTKGNPEDCAAAKRIALDLGKLCARKDEQKKKDKSYYATVVKYIDSLNNTVENFARLTQADAKEISDYFENQEKERLRKLAEERIAALSLYAEGAETMNLELMSADAFDIMLTGYKQRHEAKIEAEKQAEIEKQKDLIRQQKEQEKLKAEAEALRAKQALITTRMIALSKVNAPVPENIGDIPDKEYAKLLEAATIAFTAKEKEAEENRAKQLAAEKELARIKAQQEADEKAKRDAQIEAERLEKEKKAAEAALLASGDKDQLMAYIKSFVIPTTTLNLKSKEGKAIMEEISTKFAGFKSWGEKLIKEKL